MKPKCRGLYTVDWPNAKEERAFFDGENWYRFASDTPPERITHTWESGAPRPINVWRDVVIDPGWYHVNGALSAMFWDGSGWSELVRSDSEYTPVRATLPPGSKLK